MMAKRLPLEVSFSNDVEQLKPNAEDIVSVLPQSLRSEARILVPYLKNVNINDVQRIVYSDGVVGSPILDLVSYAVSSSDHERPLDWPRFKNLLNSLGVSDSVISKPHLETTSSSMLDKWLTY